MTTILILLRKVSVCSLSQSLTHAPVRPGANPSSDPGPSAEQSTNEVSQGSDRFQTIPSRRGCQVVCVNTSEEVSTDDGCHDESARTAGVGAPGRVCAGRGGQAGPGCLLDELMAQVDEGSLQLTGEGGFLPELVKRVLEAGLAAELSEHLGYERHDRAGHGSGNSRNGSTGKRLGTEVGDVDLATPRDRNGSFEPRLVPKGQRRVGGLSDMIISLYAGGMTIRDIQAHLERTLGTELSHETIANITDAVAEEVKAWQARPLEAVYPILYLDALVVKVKDNHQVPTRPPTSPSASTATGSSTCSGSGCRPAKAPSS